MSPPRRASSLFLAPPELVSTTPLPGWFSFHFIASDVHSIYYCQWLLVELSLFPEADVGLYAASDITLFIDRRLDQ
ncbi:hypothetical protein Ancab_014114 [Ancistrocladus abbreviatus]